MYSNDSVEILSFHRFLLSDKARELYRRALFDQVRSGDVVLDLGTGTGILALFACQAGARRVYGIEAGKVIELAKIVCARNGLKERVVFIKNLSLRVDLPERVDLMVTDIFETFGLQDGLLGTVMDARKRFLDKDGVIIPSAVSLFVAPVELDQTYDQEVNFWARDIYGLDFSPVQRAAKNNIYPLRLEPGSLLADPVLAKEILLAEVETPQVHCDLSLSIVRSGVLHGLVGWFASKLTNDIILSNEPGSKTTNYAQAFLPVNCPVPVEQGDWIRVVIDSYDGAAWKWQVEIEKPSKVLDSYPDQKMKFDHSTLWGFPLSKEELYKSSSNYAPSLCRSGEAESFVLSSFDGEKTIGEIEKELFSHYPDSFHSQQEASAFVREIVMRCA